MNELGARVRALREVFGWSQSDLSRRSGVSQPIISRLEAGLGKRPTAHNIQALASAFGLSMQDLLEDETTALVQTAGQRNQADRQPTPEDLLRQAADLLARERERREREGEARYEVLPNSVILVPIVKSFAAAGEGAVAEQELWPYVPRPEEVGHLFAAIVVRGNCLAPRVQDGDVAVIDKSASPNVSDVVAAQVDGESLLRIYQGEVLTSLNGHPPIRVDEHVHIEGVVVFVGRRP